MRASLLMTSSPGGSCTVPVDHLDYSYIQQCGDLKYLEKILHVLRSGIEGVYPHLTEFCEKRIETLDPRHRALRKDTCPATTASFSADEWKHISDDLQAWQREITETEQWLKQSLIFNTDTLPPVHNRAIQIPRNTAATTTHSNGCSVTNSTHTHLPQNIDTSALTQQEKCVLANREREKGNEAFRARDWNEAIVYYTRALQLKPFSVKALLRRAVAFETLEKFPLAYVDYRTVQQIHNTHSVQQHVNRLSQMLMEQDGPDWKTKLPEVLFVPISAHHDGAETRPTSQTTPTTHTVATTKTPPITETLPTVKTSPTIQFQTTVETPPISGPSQTHRRIKIIEVDGDADEDEEGDNEDDKDEDGEDKDDEDEDDMEKDGGSAADELR